MSSQDMDALLWAAIEDYAGLWEAVWELRAIHPDWDDVRLQERAKDVLAQLRDDDLIEFFACQEPYGDIRPIDSATANAAFDRDNWWEPPADGRQSIRFSATAAGRARG